MADSIKFLDGFEVKVGQRVSFRTKYGTQGTGTVIGIDLNGSRVKIDTDEGTEFAPATAGR